MTPDVFRATLATLGWSQRHLAYLLACDTNLPTRWATGRATIPPSIAAWLKELVRYHYAHPVPQDWRVRETHGAPTCASLS